MTTFISCGEVVLINKPQQKDLFDLIYSILFNSHNTDDCILPRH